MKEEFWVYAGDDVRENAAEDVAKDLDLNYEDYKIAQKLYCQFPYSVCIIYEFDADGKGIPVGLKIEGRGEWELEE